jgi:hypothetical protein
MWVTVSLYMTVIAWLYAVGKIIALLQEPAFRRVLAGTRFARRVRALREPFVIVCGYGETGAVLVEALDRRRLRATVIELNDGRVSEVDLQEHASDVYALRADARLPQSLLAAGLRNPECRGLVALTNDDAANLAAAVDAKLLRPELPVLARCESAATGANMASFGTDHIINAFEVFARELGLAVHSPSQYLLRDWLTAVPGMPLAEQGAPDLAQRRVLQRPCRNIDHGISISLFCTGNSLIGLPTSQGSGAKKTSPCNAFRVENSGRSRNLAA